MKLFFLGCIIFFLGCSTKTPQNDWQYKSVSAFELYKTNFLQGNALMASHELKLALHYARQSADLETLLKIYLSQCALNSTVLQNNGCTKYEEISKIEQNTQSKIYYDFLQNKLHQADIQKLPFRYRAFANALVKKNYKHAEQKLLQIDDDISKFIAAAMIKERLSNETRRAILHRASYHGYKKLVLFWLHELKNHTSNKNEQEKIAKKIALLSKG